MTRNRKDMLGKSGPKLTAGGGFSSNGGDGGDDDYEFKKKPKKPASSKKPAKKPSKNKSKIKETDESSFQKGFFKRLFCTWAGITRLFSVLLTFFIIGLAGVGYMAIGLPDINGLAAANKTPAVQVYDAEGGLIANYGDIYGKSLDYQHIPQNVIDALIATEDRHFFSHFGIDPLGILRAAFVNFRRGKFVQGGSTITQQLAKNVFLTPDRTLKRKFQEMLLAFWLEARFSKQEILSIYLNRVYLGSGNYGIDAAARNYFGKPATDLNLAESAVIVGLLKAPSRYAPTNNIDRSRGRAEQVLLNMVDADMLEKDKVKPNIRSLHFPESVVMGDDKSGRYFSNWVVDSLPDIIGRVEDDIIVKTTLNPQLEQAAESSINTLFDEKTIKEKNVHEAALVSLKPTGEILAMVGGRKYAKSQYNRATQAKRQPGSSFKMFVYLAALEAGMTPDDMVDDHLVTYGKWQPHNYDGKYLGNITLRQALAESVNTIAVQLTMKVGVGDIINTARRLGITSPIERNASIALGAVEVSPLEMATAYAHLSAGGKGVRPYGIVEIRRKKDNKLLYKQENYGDYLVIDSNIVAMMNNMLSGVISFGTGKAANFGYPAAGKTGTTSDYKDAWFVGYTNHLTTAVWVGNDDSTPMKKVTGGALPAKIWHDYMQIAHQGLAPQGLSMDYNGASTTTMPDSKTLPTGNMLEQNNGNANDSGNDQPNYQENKGFWDKLLDGDNVEHTYPTAR